MVGQIAPAVRNRLCFAGHDRGEGLVLQRRAGQTRQIVGGGVVVVGGQPVRVGEMRVLQPQFGRALVHQQDEVLHRPAGRDGQRGRRVVARLEHQPVQQVGDGDLLALGKINRRALDPDGLLRHGDDRFRVQPFDGQQRGHNFRGRGHPHPRMRVTGGQDIAALLHHDVGRRGGGHGAFLIIYARAVDRRGQNRLVFRQRRRKQRQESGRQQRRGQRAGQKYPLLHTKTASASRLWIRDGERRVPVGIVFACRRI